MFFLGGKGFDSPPIDFLLCFRLAGKLPTTIGEFDPLALFVDESPQCVCGELAWVQHTFLYRGFRLVNSCARGLGLQVSDECTHIFSRRQYWKRHLSSCCKLGKMEKPRTDGTFPIFKT